MASCKHEIAQGASARTTYTGAVMDNAAAAEHTPGTPYHSLACLRPAWSPWWRGMLTVLLTAVVWLIAASLLLIGAVIVLSLAPGHGGDVGARLGDSRSPLDVLLQVAFGALLAPAAWIGVRWAGQRPPVLLWSVLGHVRWSLLRVTAPVVLGVFALVAALPPLLGGVHTDGAGPGSLVAVALLVLVGAPLQVAGEELAFRGVGMQAIGSWLRSPVWAVLICAAASLVGRGYDLEAVIAMGALGVCAGFLAWKTGGLELPILLHLGAVGMTSLAAPFGGPVAPSGPTMTIAIVMVTVVLTVWIDQREGLGRLQPVTRSSQLPVPEVAPV